MILLSECVVRMPCVTVALTLKSGHWAVERDHILAFVFQITMCRCWFVSMNVWGNLPHVPAASHQSRTFFPCTMTTYSLPTIEVKHGLPVKTFRGGVWIIRTDIELSVSWSSAFFSCDQEMGVHAFSLSPHVAAAQNKSRRWNYKCTNIVTMLWKLYCIDILWDFKI